MLRHHVFLMVFYATGAGIFFALLWKRETRDRIRMFLIVFLSLLLGGIALGWAMYPLPVR